MTQLTVVPQTAVVPQGYAEKAMASLMQLHDELMHEKERRVELVRSLMEREQQVAELKAYVRMLEERLGPAPQPAAAPRVADEAPPAPAPPKARAVASTRVGEGWKVW
jgi:hypothetical protein